MPEQAVELLAVDAACCLARFSLRVAPGERLALVGPNGVGKTTLLRVIARLLPVTGGVVRCGSSIGYVPQDYRASFLPWLSAERNVLLALEATAVSAGDGCAQLQVLLESLAIDRACVSKHPHRLSGGQQQLLALARALLGEPRVLLLDEPFSALDTARRARARAAVAAAAQRTGATVVLVSHDLEDVVAVASRVIALDGTPARATADLPLASAEPGVLAELFARERGRVMDWLGRCAQELAGPTLWLDVGATLARVLVGVGVATVIGWALGLVLGRGALLWRRVEPLVDFLRAIPPVLAFPACLVLFGYTETARVAAIVFGTVGIVLLHVASGLARAPAARRDTARLAGLRGLALVLRVDFFEALPALFLGVRLALTAGLIVAVVSEMLVGSEHGLGARALDALVSYRSDLLALVILLAGGTGFALSAAVVAVERRVVHWQS